MMTYCYTNLSEEKPKVIRVEQPGFYLERSVLPGQVVRLQVPLGAVLEVYTGPVTTVREDTIRLGNQF